MVSAVASSLLMVWVAMVVGMAGAMEKIDPRDETCCPLLPSRPKEFKKCTTDLAYEPNCTLHELKCHDKGRWYKVGQTLNYIPQRCMRVSCQLTEVENGLQPSITTEVSEVGKDCCIMDRAMYPHGYRQPLEDLRCTRIECKEGEWKKTSNPKCLKFDTDLYFPDEIMWMGKIRHLCVKWWNEDGRKDAMRAHCCCIHENEMYKCGQQISFNSTNCTLLSCEEGYLTHTQVGGCCAVGNVMFGHGDVVDYGSKNCLVQVCNNGSVMEQPAEECCEDSNGILHPPHTVVVKNLAFCYLQLCSSNGTIIEMELRDILDCCEIHGNLYRPGTDITLTPCVNLTCKNGGWVEEVDIMHCQECHLVNGQSIKTFDGAIYSSHGACDVVMVQKHLYRDNTSKIIVNMTKCRKPFSMRNCSGAIIVTNEEGSTFVIDEHLSLKMNGHAVELPYSTPEKETVWDAGDSIKMVIFSGFFMVYKKYVSLPDIYIIAPKKEVDSGWHGMCGQIDGEFLENLEHDLGVTPVQTDFVDYWCVSDKPRPPHLPCTQKPRLVVAYCMRLMQMKPSDCRYHLDERICTEVLCSCDDGMLKMCYRMLVRKLDDMCGPLSCPEVVLNITLWNNTIEHMQSYQSQSMKLST